MPRLYFTVPDIHNTKLIVNQLLLKRIDIKHINVVAKEGTDLGDLPEAKLSVRSDIRHSLIFGGLLGGLVGVGAGLAFHYELSMPLSGLMIITTLVGVVFGAWAASMIGMVAENTDLAPFSKDIKNGKFILVVDVPRTRVEEITAAIIERHPETKVTEY